MSSPRWILVRDLLFVLGSNLISTYCLAFLIYVSICFHRFGLVVHGCFEFRFGLGLVFRFGLGPVFTVVNLHAQLSERVAETNLVLA